MYSETFTEKLKRKCKENPLIPLAIGSTIFFMGHMLRNLLLNDKMGFQYSQRYRLGAQSLGISALAFQVYLNSRSSSSEKQ
jgi:hypothetical protein